MSRKHGMTNTRMWRVWSLMIQRCYDLNCHAFKNYGGRGIRVCKRWHDFKNFYADVGEPPSAEHSIDRIRNNGPYAPDNWRWATKKEQANNRRNNTLLTAFGRTQTMAQWADELGINRATICQRLARGATHSEALRPLHCLPP